VVRVPCCAGDAIVTVTPGRLDPACVTVPVNAPVVPCANAPAATRSSRKKQIVNRCGFISFLLDFPQKVTVGLR
jgi:hypothetical protein